MLQKLKCDLFYLFVRIFNTEETEVILESRLTPEQFALVNPEAAKVQVIAHHPDIPEEERMKRLTEIAEAIILITGDQKDEQKIEATGQCSAAKYCSAAAGL